MPPKKGEVQTAKLTNDAEYEQFINQPGKIGIIDCHPRWCGPCKPIVSFFKRLKIELPSQNVLFAVATIDDIETLAPFHNTNPEPVFLFYSEGTLIDTCFGCNGPLLTKKAWTQCENEEKIATGELDRIAVPMVAMIQKESTPTVNTKDSYQSINSKASVSKNSISDNKQVTFSVITPSYLEQAEEIRTDIIDQYGVEILDSRQVTLTEEDIRLLLPNLDQMDNTEDVISYLTSGASEILILTRTGEIGVGIIKQMIEISGPTDQTRAQADFPDSINSLHGNMAMISADSADEANACISNLFPDFVAPVAVSSKTSNTTFNNNFIISGALSENEEHILINYGGQILYKGADKDDENNQVLVIGIAKSLNNMKQFIEGNLNNEEASFEISADNVDRYLEEDGS